MSIEQVPGVVVENIRSNDDAARYVDTGTGTRTRPQQQGYTVTVVVNTEGLDWGVAWGEAALKAASRAISDPMGYWPVTLYGWADFRLVAHGRPIVIDRRDNEDGAGERIVADVVFRFRYDPEGSKERDHLNADRLLW